MHTHTQIYSSKNPNKLFHGYILRNIKKYTFSMSFKFLQRTEKEEMLPTHFMRAIYPWYQNQTGWYKNQKP